MLLLDILQLIFYLFLVFKATHHVVLSLMMFVFVCLVCVFCWLFVLFFVVSYCSFCLCQVLLFKYHCMLIHSILYQCKDKKYGVFDCVIILSSGCLR